MDIRYLSAFGIAFIASAIICLLAMLIFPWFRSGERKPGDFRPDDSSGSGSFQIEVRRGRAKPKVVARSRELPLLGGVAMVLAICIASVAAGEIMGLTSAQWLLLEIILLGTLGFALVGFVDDARKVSKGVGISEGQKALGVMVVSGVTAYLLNHLIIAHDVSTQLAYPPYTQAPIIGQLLVKNETAWVIFFIVMTIVVASVTALAVDFSDGMDGLAGGLLLSAGLSYAAILLDEGGAQRGPLIIGALVLAGAALGYLPFNWPSSWKGGPNPKGKRWARLIMGDTGSLALGGMLALIAIVARQELLLIIIGGAFVLEGLSALISARILVKFYRRFLFVERFGASKGFPHTEFPLPFLATPMHHHYDLLNVDRKRLVYGAWLLGAGLGVLGIATAVGPFTWERYLARLAALVLLIAVWQAGPWTKAFFIGLESPKKGQKDAPRKLILCHGSPFRLFGIPMYRRIDESQITDRSLESPSEQLLLWQRLSVFDARALLGYFCYREGDYQDALRIWDRLPDPNIDARPDIKSLIQEATNAVAIERSASRSNRRIAPNSHGDDPGSASWRAPVPPAGMAPSPRLQPMNGSMPHQPNQDASAALWQPNRWAAANGIMSTGAADRDPARTYPPVPTTSAQTTQPASTAADSATNGMAPADANGNAPTSASAESDAIGANTSLPGVQRPAENNGH